jgi:hypothetical protein
MGEYAPFLMWGSSVVGRASLNQGLIDLSKASYELARRLQDPVLTEESVTALVEFLSEDVSMRSGCLVRALFLLKARRVRAGAAGIDFAHVIAVCDLFSQQLSLSSAAVRGRLPLDGSPECSFVLACEYFVDLLLAHFREHVRCLSVARPSALDGNC